MVLMNTEDLFIHLVNYIESTGNTPNVIIRTSDGMRFNKNDDGTYTREGQKDSMPTTYYKHSYSRLMGTGAFRHL